MYETYFGLKSKPFQLNPDPVFYFASKQHRRAKAYLEYGVHRNEGFIVITGEVGAGKTTVVRGLLDSLDARTVIAANLVSTQLDAEDTLRLVGAAFGVKVKDLTKAELLISLEAHLAKQVSRGKRCLLIVDEAQNLTSRAVEELRMLSNFQYGEHALLQTFLVGHPEFREMLQSKGMQQLRQRVTATCHIGPMDLEETKGYIEHRLKCAGSTGRPKFDKTAFEGIFKASGGIPRRINTVCDRLLLQGFLEEKDAFTIKDVNEVVNEIAEELGPSTDKTQAPKSGPIADDSEEMHRAEAALEIDLSKLEFDANAIVKKAQKSGQPSTEQNTDCLQRIELSLLRLECINLEILDALKKQVIPAKKTQVENQK
jgi:general secretion pathway protein A